MIVCTAKPPPNESSANRVVSRSTMLRERVSGPREARARRRAGLAPEPRIEHDEHHAEPRVEREDRTQRGRELDVEHRDGELGQARRERAEGAEQRTREVVAREQGGTRACVALAAEQRHFGRAGRPTRRRRSDSTSRRMRSRAGTRTTRRSRSRARSRSSARRLRAARFAAGRDRPRARRRA